MIARSLRLLALVVAGSALAESALSPATGAPWRRIDSEHLTVVGQVGEDELREVVRRMESSHVALETLFHEARRRMRPTYVYAFGDRESFLPYSGGIEHSEKHFHLRPRLLSFPEAHHVAILAGADRDESYLIEHEYGGLIVGDARLGIAPWHAVGLEELVAGLTIDGETGWIGASRHRFETRFAAEVVDPPVEALLRARSEGELRAVADYRLWCWLLAHEVHVARPALEGRVEILTQRLEAGEPIDAALAESFGGTAEELGQRLRERSKQEDLVRLPIDLSGLDAVARLPVETLSPADVLVALAPLLMGDAATYDRAEAHVREALRIAPEHAGAHSALGTLLVQRGRREEAIAPLRKALELDPSYAPAMLGLGELLLASAGEAPGDPRLDEARRLLEAHVERHPAAGYTRDLLADAIVRQGDCDALAALDETRIPPDDADRSLARALAFAKCAAPARARACLDRLPRAALATDRARSVSGVVLEAELREVKRLATGGDPAGAARVLATAIEHVPDPGLRARLQSQLEMLRGMGDRGAWLDRYDAAYALIEEGRLDEAEPLLREIREKSGQPDLVEAAAEQLRRIELRRGE